MTEPSTLVLTDLLACGHCAGPLAAKDRNALYCSTCDRSFDVRDDVVFLGDRQDYSFQGIPFDMDRFLADRRERGWDPAFATLLDSLTPKHREYMNQYVNDFSRAAWRFLTRLPEGGVAVDFGCGWGAIAIGLTYSCGQVVAMELSPGRSEATAAHAQALKIGNLLTVQAGDTPRLALADHSVDLFALNGVLEWVATTRPGAPRACQIEFLREVHRVLKPGGELYIGIENRFGWPFFKGVQDHQGSRYTSLMPRWLADRECKRQVGESYRAYTYSRRGYIKLLQEAGFPVASIYTALPHYSEARTLIDLSRASNAPCAFAPRTWKGKLLLGLLKGWNFLKGFTHCFAIVAAKRGGRSFVEELVQPVLEELGQTHGRVRITHMNVTNSNKAVVYLTDSRSPRWVLLLGTDPVQDAKVRDGLVKLKSFLANEAIPEAIRSMCPRLLSGGEHHGVHYSLQEHARGRQAITLVGRSSFCDRFTDTGHNFLVDMHVGTARRPVFDRDAFAQLLKPALDYVGQMQDVSLLRLALESELIDHELPLVYAHWDFVPINVFADPHTAEITSVIDWELGGENQLPMMDWMGFLAQTEHESKGVSLADAFATILGGLDGPGQHGRLFSDYCSRLQLSREVGMVLAFFAPIFSVHGRAANAKDGLVKCIPQLIDMMRKART